MLKSEFDEISTYDELVSVANEYSYSFDEDFVGNGDELDSAIFEDIADVSDHWYWHTVREMLESIELGYDYYQRTGTLEYVGQRDGDDLFYELKESVGDYLSINGYFEDEEEEEEEEDPFNLGDTESLEDIPEPDFSIAELIARCSENIKVKVVGVT